MTDWFPIVFFTLKLLVISVGMFFAIKWHYDQGKKGRKIERREVVRAGGKVAAIFVFSLVVLGVATYFLCRMLGLELSFS